MRKIKKSVIIKTILIFTCLLGVILLWAVASGGANDESSEYAKEYENALENVAEKYRSLESVKAACKLQAEYNKTCYMRLNGKIDLNASEIAELLGAEASYIEKDGFILLEMKYYFDFRGEVLKKTGMERLSLGYSVDGQTFENEIVSENLLVGDLQYEFDHPSKKYYSLNIELPKDIVGVLLDTEMITNVETKKETVEGVEYTVDSFSYTEGEVWNVFTKNGNISHFRITKNINGKKLDFITSFEISDDISFEDFEIPKGYTNGDEESSV